MRDFYDVLAAYYDGLQEDINPNKWASFIHELATKYRTSAGEGEGGAPILVDLGCGSGRITTELATKFGYEAIGIDRSFEMLNKAREYSAETAPDILWLNQDITDYELYGAADVFISTLDTINHITDEKLIDKLFASFVNYMATGAVFIFDIGTKKHFAETLGDNVFFQDDEDYTLLWANSYEEDTGMSFSEMTIFYTEDGRSYKRTDGVIKERYYSVDYLAEIAAKYGLKLEAVTTDLEDKPETSEEERIFVVFRRITEYGK